jgi:PKD domain-containing protein
MIPGAVTPIAYEVVDEFFGPPYIDIEEQRDLPSPHLYIHGGFAETATRFSIYFPPEEIYQGRFLQPLEAGAGGHENIFGAPVASMLGGFEFAVGLGAYMVESNQGHIGTELCQKAGLDSSIYGWRASTESARFARHLATQYYGEPPHHGYVFGGSGGGIRTSACIEMVHDVWDGAVPFIASMVAPFAAPDVTMSVPFATMLAAQRVLGKKLADVVDAREPGGSGDPFQGLSNAQRQALYDLYRSGFPRGAEWMIESPSAPLLPWAWRDWHAQDPEYYDRSFWTEPGYMGHDDPPSFVDDLIDNARVTVRRVVTVGELAAAPAGSPESTSPWARIGGHDPGLAIGAVIDRPPGFLQGAHVQVMTGAAAGRRLCCLGVVGDTILVDGIHEVGNLRFAGVEPGDELLIDNRNYLAFCSRYRHVVNPKDPTQAHLVNDGVPIYPQRSASQTGPHKNDMPFSPVGICAGKFQGKVIDIENTHDTSAQPRARNDEGLQDRYVLRWTENAEHMPAQAIPVTGIPVPTTRLIDYLGILEQSLHDLVDWVENGVRPAGTTYTLEPGGPLRLPASAAERGGIQPVVRASANASSRAEVAVGEPVTLEVEAEVPPGAGTIIDVEWDFDGSGTWPFRAEVVDGTMERLTSTTTHVYETAGTYFPAARVTSHRQGDVNATSRRVVNLGRARVVVK